jgi:hypothetical protein
MQDRENTVVTKPRRVPWNKGKLIGAKPPLRPKHVWSIRTKLQVEGRTRDLAMFNLAIDSKLRGCCRPQGRGCRSEWICSRSGNGPTEKDGTARQSVYKSGFDPTVNISINRGGKVYH